MKQRIGHATDYQMAAMFQRFYPDQSADRAMEFAACARSHQKDHDLLPISMAMIQGFFMLNKHEPSNVLKNISHMWNL